ncbi:MAG: cyclophilin-like fold protein [Candidatus Thorarchaeota archaeon]
MSAVEIEIEFDDGTILTGVLDTVLGPLILADIKAAAPIEGRAALMRGEMQITIGIKRGNRRPTNEVKKGDIAYMPLGDNLCIYLKDTRTFSPVNILGKVTSEDVLENLDKIRRGSRATFRVLQRSREFKIVVDS